MWGDNPDDKDEEDMRITSTNINGLSNTSELSEYIIGSKRFVSDINCFQELNVNTNRVNVVQDLRKAINDVDEIKGSTFQISSPPEGIMEKRSKSVKKRGGTMVHVETHWTGSNLHKNKDGIGRWSSVTVEGKGTTRLTIFSAYRVNENTVDNAGGETIWFQEYKALLEKGIKQPDPRQQVLDDLEEEINKFREDKDHHIILCIDANESTRKDGKSKLNDFIHNSGLVDCHRHCHPELEETPT